MKQFNDLGLAEPLLQAVSAEGYTHPTPIQAEVIPALLAGRDVLGIAQTGTGKTAAFVLPLLNELVEQPAPRQPKSCRAVILAPTRELAAQIVDSIRTYGRKIRPSVTLIVGGVRQGPQIRAMAPGVDILVATPGRLLDHMGAGAIRLDATTTVVLDEADQMLDLGFMPAIRRIMAKVPAKRRTVLLSATMPKQIRGLANDFLTNPAEIAVTPASKPIERIEQRVIHVDKSEKRRLLVDVLKDAGPERAIVFTRTKRGADRVCRHLQEAGLGAAAIHGDKSQGQRERALGSFRNGNVAILVATDIAARGIDVDDVSHVVNFELPNVPEAYVHRIGRTARAGKSGFAVSLCEPTEREYLRDIEKLIGNSLAATRATNDGEAPVRRETPAATPRPEKSADNRGDKPAGKRRRNRRRGGGAERSGQPQAANANGNKSQHGKPRNGNAQGAKAPGRKARSGKPQGGAKPLSRLNRHGERRPGNETADAGLARMLGNLGG